MESSYMADSKEDEELFNYIEQKTLPKIKLFGTNRNSFVQKLSSMIELRELSELLQLNLFDLSYTSLDGKALLDNYLDKPKELKMILSFYKEILPAWMDSSRYRFREGVVEMLKYENAVISMANSDATKERVLSTASKKCFKAKEFLLDVEKKRVLVS
jgi:hypothetical protein